MTHNTRASLILKSIASYADDNTAIDSAAIGMFTADMSARLAAKRAEGRHGWWDPNTCSVETLAQMLIGFIHRGELLDAANLCMFLYCREGGAEACAEAFIAAMDRKP